VVLDGSIQRKEIPEIPIEAICEVIINSFCHRLYTSSQNNEITIYSNRIEIYNPGTFPEGLTPQDCINGKERSKKRNPLLAQLMYYTKDIESFGSGLRSITEACKAAGVKVEFEMLKLGFAVVFYRPGERRRLPAKPRL
jgi:ATP-dependent DNA helicase RecG